MIDIKILLFANTWNFFYSNYKYIETDTKLKSLRLIVILANCNKMQQFVDQQPHLNFLVIGQINPAEVD